MSSPSSSSTTSSSSITPPYSNMSKASIEKKRREDINVRIEQIRSLIIEDKNDQKYISHGEILHRAVHFLKGTQYPSQPSSPSRTPSPSFSPESTGPTKTLKEIKKHREQIRRDLQVSGFQALQDYVTSNQFHGNSSYKLDRTELLDIVISHIHKMRAPVPPVLPLPLLNPQLLFFWTLMLQNQLQNNVPKDPEYPKEDDEVIDVVN